MSALSLKTVGEGSCIRGGKVKGVVFTSTLDSTPWMKVEELLDNECFTVEGYSATLSQGPEAFMAAKTLKETFKELDKGFWLVLNKATPKTIPQMKEKAREMGFEIKGLIRFDEEVFESCMEGKVLKAKTADNDVMEMLRNIQLL